MGWGEGGDDEKTESTRGRGGGISAIEQIVEGDEEE